MRTGETYADGDGMMVDGYGCELVWLASRKARLSSWLWWSCPTTSMALTGQGWSGGDGCRCRGGRARRGAILRIESADVSGRGATRHVGILP